MVAGAIGTATFVITTTAQQPPAWSWMLSVFVGGVVLVVQFLVNVDGQLADLRRDVLETATAGRLIEMPKSGPLSRDTILQLVTNAASFHPAVPPLVRHLAQAEMNRVSNFVRDAASGSQIVYDGDDWYWCFSLIEHTNHNMDATTYFRSKDGVHLADDDLWFSELGQRYLHSQAEAVGRGVPTTPSSMNSPLPVSRNRQDTSRPRLCFSRPPYKP